MFKHFWGGTDESKTQNRNFNPVGGDFRVRDICEQHVWLFQSW